MKRKNLPSVRPRRRGFCDRSCRLALAGSTARSREVDRMGRVAAASAVRLAIGLTATPAPAACIAGRYVLRLMDPGRDLITSAAGMPGDGARALRFAGLLPSSRDPPRGRRIERRLVCARLLRMFAPPRHDDEKQGGREDCAYESNCRTIHCVSP